MSNARKTDAEMQTAYETAGARRRHQSQVTQTFETMGTKSVVNDQCFVRKDDGRGAANRPPAYSR